MHDEEEIFKINETDMQRLIEYIKEALEVEYGDEILVCNGIWRLIIAKNTAIKEQLT